MDAAELVTVLCGVLALGAAAALAVACSKVRRAAADLAAAAERFDREATPAVEELREAARSARAQVDRVDHLVEVAGSIGERVDSATEATYRALTSPVIKGVAFASGTRRAARRLRDGGPPASGRRHEEGRKR
jgi:hypothetical protein